MVNMSLLEEAKLLLQRHRINLKKRFGQNFMVNPSVFQRIAEHAFLTENDVSLDIGAGLGFLTRFLAEKCRSVLAVELDKKLVKLLRNELKSYPNVEIIEGSIFRIHVPPFDKVVSIPPYGFSSKLLLWLFKRKFKRAVLVFQKEFAKRLIAPIGSEEYGWLSVITYYNAEVELLDEVPNWRFFPRPKVNSVILHLRPRLAFPFRVADERLFQKLTRFAFAHRNRKIRKVLLSFIKTKRVSSDYECDNLPLSFALQNKRVRELAPEDFGELANALAIQKSVFCR